MCEKRDPREDSRGEQTRRECRGNTKNVTPRAKSRGGNSQGGFLADRREIMARGTKTRCLSAACLAIPCIQCEIAAAINHHSCYSKERRPQSKLTWGATLAA